MKVVGAEIFPLCIPFVNSFEHAGGTRGHSDSIVVKLYGEDGAIGYGEGIARPYVTGETVAGCLEHMQRVLWPVVQDSDFPELRICDDPLLSLAPIESVPPDPDDDRIIAWHGARAAFETALIDVLLKRQGLSLSEVLRPRRPVVTYSAVIGLGSIEQSCRTAERCRQHGLTDYKCKIGREDIRPRLQRIRKVIGRKASLRLDANCAFDSDSAAAALAGLDRFNVTCIEQPTPRIDEQSLADLQRSIAMPLMADESLVTVADSRRLIAAGACRWFNLRVAKCGGVVNVLHIARLATAAGTRLQIGCQVGETAILSAMGRHLAAHLGQVEFVEGSYGSRLLERDIAEPEVCFGAGGRARLIRGCGIGVHVDEALLRKYTTRILSLGSCRPGGGRGAA